MTDAYQQDLYDAQFHDPQMLRLKDKVKQGLRKDFTIGDGALFRGTRLYVPVNKELIKDILDKAPSLAYAMHPDNTKMYCTLFKYYCWERMKRKIARYMAKSLVR